MPSPKKILLPVDIAHMHKNFVGQLTTLLPLKNAEVKLLFVKEEMPAYENAIQGIGNFPDDWQNQLIEKVKGELEKLKVQLQEFCQSVSIETVSGPPALMIETVATDENMDLIAIMPGDHNNVERFLLGSTTSRVVKHAVCDVFILRPERKVEALKNVLIGVDGSEKALNSLRKAVSMFELAQTNVKVTLLNAVSITGILKYISPIEFIASVEDNLTMTGEIALAEAKKLLFDLGVKDVDIHLRSGDPAEQLLKLADEISAELIVTGAQGKSSIEQMLLGSVSAKTAVHAKCSMMVVK